MRNEDDNDADITGQLSVSDLLSFSSALESAIKSEWSREPQQFPMQVDMVVVGKMEVAGDGIDISDVLEAHGIPFVTGEIQMVDNNNNNSNNTSSSLSSTISSSLSLSLSTPSSDYCGDLISDYHHQQQ